jgi:heat shock protein HslJ/uncharacterized lipoprotein YbaY
MRLALFIAFIFTLAIFPLLNLDNTPAYSNLTSEAIAATPTTEVKLPVTIKGALTYNQRIALPSESAVILAIKENNTDLTAYEQSYALNGKQVPIEFSITIPESALKPDTTYYFQGHISIQGKTAWISEKVNIDAGNNAHELGNLITTTALEEVTPLTYQCGSERITFVTTKDKNELQFNDKIFEMIPVPAASGAKYRSIKGDSTIFWSKGDKAQAKIENLALDECQKIVLPENNQNAPVADLILDKEWSLVKLNGDDALADSKVTLTLSRDGRLHGKSGCNSYSGGYKLENDKIEVSKAIVSTMMACVLPGIMEQESRYTSLLSDITGLKLQEDGKLVASTEDGRILVFGRN